MDAVVQMVIRIVVLVVVQNYIVVKKMVIVYHLVMVEVVRVRMTTAVQVNVVQSKMKLNHLVVVMVNIILVVQAHPAIVAKEN
tara:strand:+ start:42 stop:290 length:249 start_codon:yes stop_codon:yes gene_type:complete